MITLVDTSAPVSVRPGDLDSLGHVNNAVALEYLEAGRWVWMEHNGLARGRTIVPVVARIEVDYRRELAYEALIVDTALVEPAALDDDLCYRAVFAQRIRVDRGGESVVAIDARVHVAFIDAESRSLCAIDEFLSNATEGRTP